MRKIKALEQEPAFFIGQQLRKETVHGHPPIYRSYQEEPPGRMALSLNKLIVLRITNILFCRVEAKIAYGRHQRINTKGQVRKYKICKCSAGMALRLQATVVDNKTADPTQEEGQKEPNNFLTTHNLSPFDTLRHSAAPHVS